MVAYSGGGGGLPKGVAGDKRTLGGLNVDGGMNINGGNVNWEIKDDGTILVGPSSNVELNPDGSIVTNNVTILADGTIAGIVQLLGAPFANLGDIVVNGLLTAVNAKISSGLGLYGFTPSAVAPRTLAQATITAIIDANAKAAVQACANALSDMGALTLT